MHTTHHPPPTTHHPPPTAHYRLSACSLHITAQAVLDPTTTADQQTKKLRYLGLLGTVGIYLGLL